MTSAIDFTSNQAGAALLATHLHCCDALFVPPLSSRTEIDGYARKIVANALCFEAWSEGVLVGMVATYCNDVDGGVAFITNVSVLPQWQGKGIASQLVGRSVAHARSMKFDRVELEVDADNTAAIRLYRKQGFAYRAAHGKATVLSLALREELRMNEQRDYDTEIGDTINHRYAYGFDFDVMHPFMIRSFAPFMSKGSLLELGSFKGDFTRRFLEHFTDITCVEASAMAISEARRRHGDRVTFVHSLFETAVLPRRYDNIVLTHVLEHLDDPVKVLRRINDEWMADGGRLFLVCPNANAPSRQIAVKMGLIGHNAAVTPAEAEHGHRRTYALDTLERDATAAGLKVVHRSGIFFKALANFQWDRLLQTDIISKEYLDGCYQFGQQYPDLCSSIFLLCERGAPASSERP